MTGNTILKVLGVIALLCAFVGGLRIYQRLFQCDPEWTRKLLHIAAGLLALALPFLFDDFVPVVFLCSSTTLALLLLRWKAGPNPGIGSVVFSVKRRSVGDLCFPVSVGLLFIVAGQDLVLYSVPLLVMVFADPVAALVGSQFGLARFGPPGHAKSIEGSAAFSLVSFLVSYVALWCLGGTGQKAALLIAILMSLLLTLVEARAGYGLDNLLIPVLGLAMLRIFLAMSVHELEVASLGIVPLVGFLADRVLIQARPLRGVGRLRCVR